MIHIWMGPFFLKNWYLGLLSNSSAAYPPPPTDQMQKRFKFYFSLFISRGQNRIVHPWFCYRVVVEIPEPHISPTCTIFVVSPWATNNMTNRPIYNSNEFYSSEILKQIDFILKLYPLNTGECSSMQYRHVHETSYYDHDTGDCQGYRNTFQIGSGSGSWCCAGWIYRSTSHEV